MKKKIMMAVMSLLLAISAQGQTMYSLWITMPDSIFPYLNRSQRIMMGDSATIANKLEETSRIDTMTSNYLKVSLTKASTVELKLFASAEGDSTLAVVTTYLGPEPESSLSFYDRYWQPLASNVQADAPMVKPDAMSEEAFELLQQKIEPEMWHYQLSPDNEAMTVSLSLPMLSNADKEEVRAILQEKKYLLFDLLQKEVK